MDLVCENNTLITITRRNGKHVVMLSLEDYNAWHESSYLMHSAKNRQRLFDSIRKVEQGRYSTRNLIEDDEGS